MAFLLFSIVCLSVAGVTYYEKRATMLDKVVKPVFWQNGPAMLGYMFFKWVLYFSMYYLAYRTFGWMGTGISMICQFFLGRKLLRHFYMERLLEWTEVYNKISIRKQENPADPEVKERNLKLANAATIDAMMNRCLTPWDESERPLPRFISQGRTDEQEIEMAEPSRKVCSIRFGPYQLDQVVSSLEGLTTLTGLELSMLDSGIAGEMVYRAHPARFLNYEWDLVISVIGGLILKIAPGYVTSNHVDGQKLMGAVISYFNSKFGNPQHPNPEFFLWEADDGEIVLQQSIIGEEFVIYLCLTSYTVKKYL